MYVDIKVSDFEEFLYVDVKWREVVNDGGHEKLGKIRELSSRQYFIITYYLTIFDAMD